MADVYLLDAMMIGRVADDRPDGEVDEKTRRVRERLKSVGDARILICAVTVGEAEFGLRTASGMDGEKLAAVRRILASFPRVLNVGEAAGKTYAGVRAALFDRFAPSKERDGRRKVKWVEDLADRTTAKSLGVQENDVWLAAVALQHNLVLVTDDRMVRIKEVSPDLRFENWLK